MRLMEIAAKLELENVTPELGTPLSVDVTRGYVTDLLSDVLAHAPRGGALVTIQTHMNVIAVSLHAELAAVIFASGRRPEEAVRKKAVEEHLPLYVAPKSAFELVGQLYALGLRGPDA